MVGRSSWPRRLQRKLLRLIIREGVHVYVRAGQVEDYVSSSSFMSMGKLASVLTSLNTSA